MTLHGQVVSEAYRKDPAEGRGSEDSQRSSQSTAKLNPQRVLLVSLCLLTLSYSIDFFTNPLSKCFSLPHSTDISPTHFFSPHQILVQLFHLVVRSDMEVCLEEFFWSFFLTFPSPQRSNNWTFLIVFLLNKYVV